MADEASGALDGAASGAGTGAMLGPWGAAAGGLIGGVTGLLAAQGDQDQAKAAQQAALAAMAGVTVPTIGESSINLNNEQLAGSISPTMQGTVQQAPNAYAGISTNPAYLAASGNALNQLGQLANGGLTATDIANLNQIRNQSLGQANAMNQAVMSNMAARGMAGGGGMLAAELANNQNAANMMGNNSMQVGAQAQQARVNALGQQASLGQSLQAQQYGQGAQAATAQNAINQFNSQLGYNTGAVNTQAINQAQYANLQNKQNVANANTGIQNQQEIANKGLYQQQFTDQLQKAFGTAGQAQNNSTYYNNQAAGTRGEFSGLGNAVGQGVSGAASAAQNQSNYNALLGVIGGKSGSDGSGSTSGPYSYNQSASGFVGPANVAGSGGFMGPTQVNMSEGGVVEGEATVDGDSPLNDTEQRNLSPGEIVIPRAFAASPQLAKAFIDHIMKTMKNG